MIEVEQLSKTFYVHEKQPGLLGSLRSLFVRKRSPRHAVRDVSFRVDEGEIVGLIGANGAGKTTLVKMLSGIVHPSSGQARVLGFEPWERDNRLRRQIALIMGQKQQLWWDLPAADCFLLLKEIYGISDADYRKNLDYLAQTLGVDRELYVQIRRLSLGERMKMELIAALLHSPRVVFLDEPTIGLDLTAQRAIRDFILEYREQHRPAMILTSHYMEDIERLCKRILIIRAGEIVFDGPLEAISTTYAAHKVVTAHLGRDARPSQLPAALADHASLLEETETELRLLVSRDQVARAAALVLEHYPVLDLSIEEEDIANIIEQIISARGEAAEEEATSAGEAAS